MSIKLPFLSDASDTSTIFDKIAFWILLATVFLLPVVVLPSSTTPLLYTKVFIAAFGILGTFLAFAAARLRQQNISFPRIALLGLVWLVPLAYLLSTLFQGDAAVSLFGERLSTDSFFFISLGSLMLTLVALVVNSRARILTLYVTLLAAAVLVAVFELFIFFAPGLLAALGVSLTTLSIIGSLNDLALFFGLIAILSLVSFTHLPLTVALRAALTLILGSALFFLAVVNLTFLWYVVGIFALTLLVFSIYRSNMPSADAKGPSQSSFSFAAALVLAFSIMFVVGGDSLRNTVASAVTVGELDVRPSWRSTMEVGSAVLGDDLLFGAGPDRFDVAWSAYRPSAVNVTPFYASDFRTAIGFIPTSFVTTGLVGILAWLVFLGSFVYLGVRMFLSDIVRGDDGLKNYYRLSAFLGALFLWVVAILGAPSPVLLVLAFAFTGIFIAAIRISSGTANEWAIEFQKAPKVGFAVTLVLTVAFLGSIVAMFGTVERFMAETYFQRALAAGNQDGDLEQASEYVSRALTLRQVDVYLRFTSSIAVTKTRLLLAETSDPEAIRERFQANLQDAIQNARQATERDGNDYNNWSHLGGVYAAVVPVGIEGAYESAVRAYDRALELRPNAPQIMLARATLERASGNAEESRVWVERTLEARPQFSEAIFLRAQLEIAEGNVDAAIQSVQAATVLNSTNPAGFFQLGLLQYSKGAYPQAIEALTRAVELNPVYANARYFLGLSLYRIGDVEGALEQFEAVQQTNPDNTEVSDLITNLRAGRAPFELEQSPVEDITELNDLPLTESPETE